MTANVVLSSDVVVRCKEHCLCLCHSVWLIQSTHYLDLLAHKHILLNK